MALFDLVFVSLVALLGGLMGLSTDACLLNRIPVCDASAAAAHHLNAVGQLVVFGLAAAVAALARPFRIKLAALILAPVLGVSIFLVANATIISR